MAETLFTEYGRSIAKSYLPGFEISTVDETPGPILKSLVDSVSSHQPFHFRMCGMQFIYYDSMLLRVGQWKKDTMQLLVSEKQIYEIAHSFLESAFESIDRHKIR